MMVEHRDFGTIFNRKDDYSIKVCLHGKSHGGGEGQENNVATPEVHQHGGDV
jgi:hypothetical protein